MALLKNNIVLGTELGRGSYGCVYSATHGGKRVAIKQISVDGYPKAIVREIATLKYLSGHLNDYPYFIKFLHVFGDTEGEEKLMKYKNVYITCELAQSDLSRMIHGSKMRLEKCMNFAWQLSCGLKHLHDCGIIHRDLKPSNIMIVKRGEKSSIAIGDFGMSRGIGEKNTEDFPPTQMTEGRYICTPSYKPPELTNNFSEYGTEVDIWAFGCILCEMFCRKVLFERKDYDNIIGNEKSGNKKSNVFLAKDDTKLGIKNEYPKINFDDICSLLYKTLCREPSNRISAGKISKHPFFKNFKIENSKKSFRKFQQPYEMIDENKGSGMIIFKFKLHELIMENQPLPSGGSSCVTDDTLSATSTTKSLSLHSSGESGKDEHLEDVIKQLEEVNLEIKEKKKSGDDVSELYKKRQNLYYQKRKILSKKAEKKLKNEENKK